MTRESDIEDYLMKRVKEVGGRTRKVRWIGFNGAPDRRVMLPPRIGPSCWVELKRPGKTATVQQGSEHSRMRKCGEIVYVINSFDQVDRLVEGKPVCSTKL